MSKRDRNIRIGIVLFVLNIIVTTVLVYVVGRQVAQDIDENTFKLVMSTIGYVALIFLLVALATFCWGQCSLRVGYLLNRKKVKRSAVPMFVIGTILSVIGMGYLFAVNNSNVYVVIEKYSYYICGLLAAWVVTGAMRAAKRSAIRAYRIVANKHARGIV